MTRALKALLPSSSPEVVSKQFCIFKIRPRYGTIIKTKYIHVIVIFWGTSPYLNSPVQIELPPNPTGPHISSLELNYLLLHYSVLCCCVCTSSTWDDHHKRMTGVIIGSGNGLSLVQHQAIAWTKDDLLWIWYNMNYVSCVDFVHVSKPPAPRNRIIYYRSLTHR